MRKSKNVVVILMTFILTWFHFHYASSQSIVKTLPGYSGNLPFKLETGYISVGEREEIELFYYFVESERNTNEDPLLLWLTGGPGCSGLNGFAINNGPVAFDATSFNGSFTQLIPKQHSWTKIANVIYIDSPVGTGFSYSTRPDSYFTSDTLSAKHTASFFRKWMLNHPRYTRNDLYVGGDSYGGKIVPMVVLEILNGNEEGLEPQTPLQGYFVGNPITSIDEDKNEKIPYAHRVGLISTEYYELAKTSCSGQYVNHDPDNVHCVRALEPINHCLYGISDLHIMEPTCSSEETYKRGVMLKEDGWLGVDLLTSNNKKTTCIDDLRSMMSGAWANNRQVQDALHVRKETVKQWERCNNLLETTYEDNVASVFPFHQILLTQKISKALVYSGDHDLTVPYIATLKWIGRLNLSMDDHWRPWYVDGQVAGYTQTYKKGEFSLTYATVKGAGHVATQNSPGQCLAMVDRWISANPL